MWEQQTGIRIGEYVRKHTSQLVGACSEDAAGDAVWAFRGLTHLNVFLTLAAVKESLQVLVAGRVSGTVLSSKRSKKLFSLFGSKTSWSATGLFFLL